MRLGLALAGWQDRPRHSPQRSKLQVQVRWLERTFQTRTEAKHRLCSMRRVLVAGVEGCARPGQSGLANWSAHVAKLLGLYKLRVV